MCGIMTLNLKVKIGKLELNNPVMVASGTFGYAQEFKDFIDLKKLGAIVTKTITLAARKGNPPPRTCETPAGMLNSIGLENPGVGGFIAEKLPFLKKLGVPLVVSIASEGRAEEFIILARRLDKIKEVSALELNISCPNIKNARRAMPACRQAGHDARLISQDAQATYELVKAVRKVTRKTLITKLSPNVTDITEIAQAAERGGSDAVSLVNTLTGMSIDVRTRKPKIASVTGGLSGPAIRPVAVRMAWDVYQKIKIPIIGMGGIMDAQSALEFIIAGASAIATGTVNFVDPGAAVEIISGLKEYLYKHKISGIKELTGSLRV